MIDVAEQARVANFISEEQVSRAQERVADLAKSNRALREVNARLARETDYTSILSVVLSENLPLMQAIDAAAFCYEPETSCLRIIGGVMHGKPISSVPDHPYGDPSRPCPVAEIPLWNSLTPGEIHVSFLGDRPSDGMVSESVLEWHRKRRHTMCLRSSLAVGTEPVGWLGVSFDHDVEPDEELMEAFRTLSQQVTLVLQLARLSESSKENAAKLAVIDERNRIARDMHDTLAHSFTAVIMQLEAAQELLATKPDVVSDCLVQATSMARSGLRQSHQAVMALQDTMPDSLTKSLPGLISKCDLPAKCESLFFLRGVPREMPAEVNRQMFRICQEALSNARRYADASKIEISLVFHPNSVLLSVEDDGSGFTPSDVCGIGFGLSGMAKRAERIGAILTIDSAVGRGTRVTVEWNGAHADFNR